MELDLESLSTKRLDHLGLVAQVCRDIHLTDVIDQCVGTDPRQHVTRGEAVLAMILNALGFVDRPLYLFPEFLQTKPLDRLIREDLTPDLFNDDLLGRTWDKLYEHGLEEIFLTVAVQAYHQEELGPFFHHDTSAWSVHGQYEPSGDITEAVPITITYGRPKNGRTDLKQFMVGLITAQELPVFIQTLSGNTADSTHFREVVQQYGERLKNAWQTDRIWIWDSKFYTKYNVQTTSADYKWITRVPETLKDAKRVLEETDIGLLRQCTTLEGYHLHAIETHYAGVPQRWIIVFSEKAYAREQATLQRQLTKERERADKQLWHLGNKQFRALADAEQAAQELEKTWKYHQLGQPHVETRQKRANGQQGRPRQDEALITVYRVKWTLQEDQPAQERALLRKGKFIIASNELDPIRFSDEALLIAYKDQQYVERGFRFLKDPGFFVPGTFLQTETRIMALVMVMGLALLVYSLAQRSLRRALDAQETPFPDPSRSNPRPTLKRVFQLFEGISVLYQGEQAIKVLGLTSLHHSLLQLLGAPFERIYTLEPG